MNRLLEIGFQLAGRWDLHGDELGLDLVRFGTRRNVLYAFVSEGDIKYIGKTTSPLAARMRGYIRPSDTQTTNLNSHARIIELLRRGTAVEVYVLPDNGLLRYGGFHINLAAGLEDDLIRSINPEWNGGRKEVVADATAPRTTLGTVDAEPDAHDELGTSTDSFGAVLHPTYYNRGFFNVVVAHQRLFGRDGESIEIFFEGYSDPVMGTINRTANMNGTPRIMGGSRLRERFQETSLPMGEVTVQVLSPTSIRIIPKKAEAI